MYRDGAINMVQIELNRSEYDAVNRLRGLPEKAHFLIMTSRPREGGGGMLVGSNVAFDQLVEFISSELAHGMARGRVAEALANACYRIDPDCQDWLGQ